MALELGLGRASVCRNRAGRARADDEVVDGAHHEHEHEGAQLDEDGLSERRLQPLGACEVSEPDAPNPKVEGPGDQQQSKADPANIAEAFSSFTQKDCSVRSLTLSQPRHDDQNQKQHATDPHDGRKDVNPDGKNIEPVHRRDVSSSKDC